MEMNLEQVVGWVTHYGVRVVGALVALFIAWIIAGAVRRAMIRRFEKSQRMDLAVGKFIASLTRYAILVGALLGVLGTFGIETTSFAALIAAAGLAVGLAFKGTLSNFASGLMLMIFRPFKVDDLVVVDGQLGFVKEIELFSTELATLDNRKIIIPNEKIFGSTIENLTHHPIRRVDIPVGVEYGADIDKTRRALEEAAKTVQGVLADPPFQIFLADLGDSSVNWQVRLWCNTADYWNVHQAAVRAAKAGLESAGLTIPFPQLDVHLDK